MSETYSIHKSVINTIFKKVVSTDAFTDKKNTNHVSDILIAELSETTIETIMHLMLADTEYKKLKIGDHVKIKPPSYHKSQKYEVDILHDIGLLPVEPDYVYGIVTGDTSWSSDKPFNPFYSRIKVDLMYHGPTKELLYEEFEVNPLHCIKTTKASIQYYKKNKKVVPDKKVEDIPF